MIVVWITVDMVDIERNRCAHPFGDGTSGAGVSITLDQEFPNGPCIEFCAVRSCENLYFDVLPTKISLTLVRTEAANFTM